MLSLRSSLMLLMSIKGAVQKLYHAPVGGGVWGCPFLFGEWGGVCEVSKLRDIVFVRPQIAYYWHRHCHFIYRNMGIFYEANQMKAVEGHLRPVAGADWSLWRFSHGPPLILPLEGLFQLFFIVFGACLTHFPHSIWLTSPPLPCGPRKPHIIGHWTWLLFSSHCQMV